MTIGDWSDTTDFWTSTPPLLISAIKCNTMFLNNWRLYKGMERLHEAQFHDYYEYTSIVNPSWFYSIRITDACPWDRLTIMEKINVPHIGTGNLQLTVDHLGAENMRTSTLDCADYSGWVWFAVIDAYDITGWAAGNHIIEVHWFPTGGTSCDDMLVKCRHAMLETSLT